MAQHSNDHKQNGREKALFLYTSALERGDFDTVAAILYRAEQDSQLEQMILEVNEVYRVEDSEEAQTAATALVQQLLKEHIPSGVRAEEVMSPLTAGQVFGRMESDSHLADTIRQELADVEPRTRNAATPLPQDLSKRSVAQFLNELGVSASKQLQKIFHETAFLLSMGRQQGHSLAATRKQTPKSTQENEPADEQNEEG